MKSILICVVAFLAYSTCLQAQSNLKKIPEGHFVVTGGRVITGVSGSFHKRAFNPDIIILDSVEYRLSSVSFFRTSEGCFTQNPNGFGLVKLVEEGGINRWLSSINNAGPVLNRSQVAVAQEFINKGLGPLKVLNTRNLRKATRDDPESHKMIKKAATLKGLSWLSMGVGLVVTVLGGLSLEEEDGEEINNGAAVTMIVGTAIVIGAIPMAFSYRNKLHRAIDQYNINSSE